MYKIPSMRFSGPYRTTSVGEKHLRGTSYEFRYKGTFVRRYIRTLVAFSYAIRFADRKVNELRDGFEITILVLTNKVMKYFRAIPF